MLVGKKVGGRQRGGVVVQMLLSLHTGAGSAPAPRQGADRICFGQGESVRCLCDHVITWVLCQRKGT